MITVEELKTDRLILKKLTIEDLNDYAEWKSNKEYYEFLPGSPKSKEEYKNSLQKAIDNYDNEENPTLIWGIYLQDKLIGSVNISQISSTHKTCEIGWGLNPKFQKQGYASEAVKCLVNYIFNNLKMNRISIVIWDGNNASKNLADKLGFIQEGIERKARIKNDKFIDLYCYGLLKEEWEK